MFWQSPLFILLWTGTLLLHPLRLHTIDSLLWFLWSLSLILVSECWTLITWLFSLQIVVSGWLVAVVGHHNIWIDLILSYEQLVALLGFCLLWLIVPLCSYTPRVLRASHQVVSLSHGNLLNVRLLGKGFREVCWFRSLTKQRLKFFLDFHLLNCMLLQSADECWLQLRQFFHLHHINILFILFWC